MKTIFTLLILFIAIQSTRAQQITHIVDWHLYEDNNSTEETSLHYKNIISVDYSIKDKTGEIKNKVWETISDSVLIKKISSCKEIYSPENKINAFSAGKKSIVEFSIFPFSFADGNYLKLKNFEISFSSETILKSSAIEKSTSILASGKWIKVSAKNQGVTKITYEKLKQMGINSPENIAIYTNGGYMLPKMNSTDYPDDLQKIPVLHTKDENNKDAIFFYCNGSVKWDYDYIKELFIHELNLYSDKTYFYLSSDVTKSSPPIAVPNSTEKANISFSNFNDHQLYEQEIYNLGKSGRLWFSDRIIQSSSKTYNFKLNNVENSKPAIISIAAAAKSNVKSKFQIQLNNESLGEIEFPRVGDNENADYIAVDFNTTGSSDLKLKLAFENTSTSGDSWVDYIRLNFISKLIFTDNQFLFRNIESLEHDICEFAIQTNVTSPIIWNITNPLSPIQINYSTVNNGISFKEKSEFINEYIVFNPLKGNFEEPIFVENIINQNIHGLPSYEMVIVTHPDFLSAAKNLAEFHRTNDNLSILILTPEEIYNEFSSGLPDPAGIRNMLRFFYNKSSDAEKLRYVLLIGDGSYDNRNYDGSKANYIPTWQSVESLIMESTFTSDDFFVLFDENEGEHTGYIDAGIGRFPCSTIFDADLIVNKIINYTSPKSMGDWRNVIAFLADDHDASDRTSFPTESETIIDTINKYYPGFYTDKIYFDSFQQISTSSGPHYPDATAAITRRVNEGALILNYIGHGNETSMASEDVLGINDIKSWKNINSLPIFVTATCDISRFDDDIVTAGENILLNPIGGGIALFTTTRVVYGNLNHELSKNFYRNVFRQDENGENLRMGDIMRIAKNSTPQNINNRKFTLLGDPALQLAFPKYKVLTQSINNNSTDEEVTIGALDKVTIKGIVANVNGEKNQDLNGTVTTTIYDKIVNVETLGNDNLKFEFPIQNNSVYKGTSTVRNGEFEFSFIVPKDIAYNIGKGRISYYFSNDTIDGNGGTDKFNIGGSSKNPIVDNTPPVIDIFLNSEKFKSNDKVASSSLLIVKLEDESGINTVGTGIGHDIIAILDNDYSNQMVLNDYYISEPDNFRKGKILYPLNNLEPGKHQLTIKAWDVHNISWENTIDFFVEEGFEIVSLSNYPNPVEFYTNFKIMHNLPGEVFDVKVELFNLLGYKVHEFSENISSSGTTEASIRWDVTDLACHTNKNQVLIYRITMKNLEGLETSSSNKLILNIDN